MRQTICEKPAPSPSPICKHDPKLDAGGSAAGLCALESVMFRIMLAGLVTVILVALTGCNAMRENSRQMVDVFKPGDYADWTDDVADPWVTQAGVEARGNRPRESTNEPGWWYRMWSTPRARDIDRNLGIDAN